MIHRAVDIYRKEGLKKLTIEGVALLVSKFVQVFFDRRVSILNGVYLERDDFRWIPTYEETLIGTIRARTKPGDTVLIVGGGLGISTVAAADRTGPDGEVIVFEGSSEYVDTIRSTVSLNEVEHRCDIRHAIVGADVNVWGTAKDASMVDPADLPDCDVLGLDCEGAELEILRHLSIRPRIVIVENHNDSGVSEQLVRNELENLGYDIVDRKVDNDAAGNYVQTGYFTGDGGGGDASA